MGENENWMMNKLIEDYALRKAHQECELQTTEEPSLIAPPFNAYISEPAQRLEASEIDPTIEIQDLSSQEETLLEEKKSWEEQKCQLILKINEVMEKKRHSIAMLRSEVELLQQKCQQYVNITNTETEEETGTAPAFQFLE